MVGKEAPSGGSGGWGGGGGGGGGWGGGGVRQYELLNTVIASCVFINHCTQYQNPLLGLSITAISSKSTRMTKTMLKEDAPLCSL